MLWCSSCFFPLQWEADGRFDNCSTETPSTTLQFIIESHHRTISICGKGRMRSPSAWVRLIYDALAMKDDHFNLQPWLATSLGPARRADVGLSSATAGCGFMTAGRWGPRMSRGRSAA